MSDFITQAGQQLELAGVPAEALAQLSFLTKGAQWHDRQPPAVMRQVVLGGTAGQRRVVIFPQAASSTRGVQDLLEVYGEYLLEVAGRAGQLAWRHKLALAEPAHVALFQEKLASRQYSTFRSLVESIDGAVARLTALHLANAFIHHRVPMADAFNTAVDTWPATAGLASGQVPLSLTPLVSAYCDSDVWQRFPVAFSQRAMGLLNCGRQDVLQKFVEVIDSVCLPQPLNSI